MTISAELLVEALCRDPVNQRQVAIENDLHATWAYLPPLKQRRESVVLRLSSPSGCFRQRNV